ncbi:MAG: CoA transferase [Pseudomonadota bacterium]
MPIHDQQAMLTGIKVLDMTSVVFGPYATQILADLGAEVIKVETPIGDVMRYAGKSAASTGMGPSYLALNRGKQSITLDLKNPEDADVMRSLVAETDVFIHNVRDKAITKLGFGYEEAKALNPDLIYVHCVGFGSGGPYASLQAYDDVIQAASGATTLASRVDGNPEPRYIPSLIADKVAGLHAAYATMAAIIHKLRGGGGQRVEVPMFEAFTGFMLKEHLAGKTFDPPAGDLLYERQVDPDRQPFPTADGFISIVPYTDQSWPILFECLGNPEVLEDERLNTRTNRSANIRLLYQAIARQTPSKTTSEWIEILRAARLPCMAVRDINDILDDPHLQQSGFFESREHPSEGAIYEMREPSLFSDWEHPAPDPAPKLGEQSEAIKANLAKKPPV